MSSGAIFEVQCCDDPDLFCLHSQSRGAIFLYALVLVCSSLALGTLFFRFSASDKTLLDAFMLACMTSTTIGFGDVHPSTVDERAFAVFYLLISTLMVACESRHSFLLPTRGGFDCLVEALLH